MARKTFYSFHYKPDSWRTSTVRSIGVIEGNKAAADNDWETITKGGEAKIQKWIDDQMLSRTCTIVLVGTNTAGRKWINYEIEKSWKNKMGIVGIHIHNLLDSDQKNSTQGASPFAGISVDGTTLSPIIKLYNPPFSNSKEVYNHISNNISNWVEEAIKIREKYS